MILLMMHTIRYDTIEEINVHRLHVLRISWSVTYITVRPSAYKTSLFTARCTLVQSAVLRSHVVCLSVCLSVRLSATLVDCDHIGWNSFKIISPLVSLRWSLFATPTWRVCSKGNTPKFGPKVTHPLLIWASETFDRKLRLNGYRQIAQRSQWRAYRKLPSLFLMVPSLTPTTSPSPKIGVSYAPNIREWQYLCNGWSDPLHVWF